MREIKIVFVPDPIVHEPINTKQAWEDFRDMIRCDIIYVRVSQQGLTLSFCQLMVDPLFNFGDTEFLQSLKETFPSIKQINCHIRNNEYIITDEAEIVYFKLRYA